MDIASYRVRDLLRLLLLVLIAVVVLAGMPPAEAQTPTDGSPPIQTRRAPFVPPPDAPRPVILAQGTQRVFPAVADTEIQAGNPGVNFGIEASLGAGFDSFSPDPPNGLNPPDARRALFHFNMTPFLPPGTEIHYASVQLYMAGYCDSSGRPFQMYRVTDDWDELDATWDSQPAFAEGHGIAFLPFGGDPWGWRSFDVTDLVRGWVSEAYAEHGVLLRGPETAYQCATRDFLSKGSGGFTNAPGLFVDYTLPTAALSLSSTALTFSQRCGDPAPAPQTVTLRSSSLSLVDWTATLDGGEGWLNLDRSGGALSHIFPDTLTMSVDEAAPCSGTATATITIQASGLASSPSYINVTLGQQMMTFMPAVMRQMAEPAPAASSTVAEPKRFALAIGITDYAALSPPPDFSPFRAGFWSTDLNERGDTPAIIEELLKANHNSVAMTEGNAQVQNVVHAISDLEAAVKAAVENDCGTMPMSGSVAQACQLPIVTIYYSGHGGQVPDQTPLDETAASGGDGLDEILTYYDTTDQPAFANYLSDDQLSEIVSRLAPARVVLLLDACNSGGMDVGAGAHALIAAAREDQNSWESSKIEHGVFTYYILRATRDPASDTNRDGWLSASELYAYVSPRVDRYVSEQIGSGAQQNVVADITDDINLFPVRQGPQLSPSSPE